LSSKSIFFHSRGLGGGAISFGVGPGQSPVGVIGWSLWKFNTFATPNFGHIISCLISKSFSWFASGLEN